MQRIVNAQGEVLHVWRAADALVLKALTIVLADVLPRSPACRHLHGNGGRHGALHDVAGALPGSRFVARTDVAAYYDSIDHGRLLGLLERHAHDAAVLNLLGQYLRYTLEQGGLFADNSTGICRGCSLSPLIGAFFLHELDAELARHPVFYARFMDDIVILAPTRWKVRRAVAAMNARLQALGLSKHPGKTFIGRIERGFEFLGLHFAPEGIRVSRAAVERFGARHPAL